MMKLLKALFLIFGGFWALVLGFGIYDVITSGPDTGGIGAVIVLSAFVGFFGFLIQAIEKSENRRLEKVQDKRSEIYYKNFDKTRSTYKIKDEEYIKKESISALKETIEQTKKIKEEIQGTLEELDPEELKGMLQQDFSESKEKASN